MKNLSNKIEALERLKNLLDNGVTNSVKAVRLDLIFDENGKLLENFDMGSCTPSFAGCVVMNQSINGWTDWKNGDGEAIDIYRNKTSK